tara:strand:+ start:433 stop:573 length:141 start_codon:yes stop_codon:yes gene_type:complete
MNTDKTILNPEYLNMVRYKPINQNIGNAKKIDINTEEIKGFSKGTS